MVLDEPMAADEENTEGIDQELLDKHKAAMAKEEEERQRQREQGEQVRTTIAARKAIQNQISEQREKKRKCKGDNPVVEGNPAGDVAGGEPSFWG